MKLIQINGYKSRTPSTKKHSHSRLLPFTYFFCSCFIQGSFIKPFMDRFHSLIILDYLPKTKKNNNNKPNCTLLSIETSFCDSVFYLTCYSSTKKTITVKTLFSFNVNVNGYKTDVICTFHFYKFK